MQQNQGQNNNTETEDEGIGVGSSKQSKVTIVALCVVFVSVVMYIIFFKSSDPSLEEEAGDEIVIEAGGSAPLMDNSLDNYTTDLIDSSLPGSDIFETPRTQSAVPALPELPELPDNLKQQIASVAAKKEDTFTKEEVDAMIDQKMKEMMEQQMNMMANMNKNQNTTTKKTETTKIIYAGIPNQEQTGTSSTTTIIKSGDSTEIIDDTELPEIDDDLDITTESKAPNEPQLSEEELLEQQQKEEAENLAKIQKQRAMQERMASPMFKINSGTGPANSIPQDTEAIILTFTNAKVEVQEKEPEVLATQVADLTKVIMQGKIIEAVLETAIDTDLSSTVRAIITRDIYAEEGKNILIPRGSRVVGTYDTNVAAGQTRVTINWTRIIRVDGMSLNITSTATDRLGRAGVQGELDNKYAQRLTNSFLSSVLSVGTSILVEKMNDSTGITSTISSLTGETTTTSGKASDYALIEATEEFMDEAQNIVDSIAEQKPVIRIPQGEKVIIMVTQDVTLPVFKRGS